MGTLGNSLASDVVGRSYSRAAFNVAWDTLAARAMADGRGGAEYRRIRADWERAGRPDPATFLARDHWSLVAYYAAPSVTRHAEPTPTTRGASRARTRARARIARIANRWN